MKAGTVVYFFTGMPVVGTDLVAVHIGNVVATEEPES